jgi:RND family efflux transporter MFP subunit
MSDGSRTLKIALPLTLVIVAAVLAAGMVALKPDVETRVAEPQPPLVRAVEVALADVPLIVRSQGTVRPRTESQLVPEVSGRVIWVSPSFAEGEFFEKGQALLKVDPHDYRQAVVRARAEVARTKLQLAREEAEAEVAREEWEDLGAGEAATALTLREPQLEDARAAVASAEANLTTAERNLERTQIRAPYAGRLRRKNVDVGQFVTVGSPVATIYSVEYAETRLPLPDDELAYVELPLHYRGETARPKGPRVTLKADFAGETFEWVGEIVRTEGEIDPASRMVHAVAQVKNPYGRGEDPDRPPLAVGLYVEAEIEGTNAEGIAVLPRAALRGRSQVLVVSPEDRLEFRDVDLLRTTREQIYVRGGLKAGERVCVSPLEAVTDGMRVRTLEEEGATPAGEAVS